MKHTHTIELKNERRLSGTVNAKRVSTSRIYRACIVATTTEKVIEGIRAGQEDQRIALARDEANLAGLCAQQGLTFEQAKAKVAALKVTQSTPEMMAARKAIRDEYPDFTARFHARAEIQARMKAAGCHEYYDDDAQQIVSLTEAVCRSRQHQAGFETPILGSQGVVTWCGSVELAQKALNGKQLKNMRRRGYDLAIRTDIEVVSK